MITWFIVAGAIALLMAYAAGQVQRMPLTTALVYLGIGYLLGPGGFGVLMIDTRTHAHLLQGITEVVIVVSIFSSALKLRAPLSARSWGDPLRLAFLAMAIGVAMITIAGHIALGLPIGTALLLGAILAPTDPVLASDVQVDRPFEFHRLRFALTGEAGMNDGSALPLVTIGLALAGVDPVSSPVWAWILESVIWGLVGALAIGGLVGYFGGRFMLHLRLGHGQKLGTDNFLALGLMGLSYGLASAAHAIGFVAVFAAGVAVRQIESRTEQEPPDRIEISVTDPTADQPAATDPEKAALFMILRVQSFTEHLERIGEAVVVIIVGALLRASNLTGEALIIAPILFFVIRPASVLLSLIGSDMTRTERTMAAWFGIRGMASVYYLAYIHDRGVPPAMVRHLADITIGIVVYSILVHGITVTPLMRWFDRQSPQP